VEIHERRFLSALPAHAHDEWRLVVVLAGAFDERTDSGTRQCAATSVIVRAPGEEHVDLFRAPLTRYASMVLPELPLRATTMGSTPLTARLTRALTRGDSPHRLMSRILEEAIEPRPVDDRVRIARETIERDYASPLRMSALARAAGLHRATLGRAFHDAYGCTPAEFLRYTRVRAAMSAIALRSETPASVALRCGFYDQSHFANAFRRVTGMTPRMYQQAAKR